MKNLINKVRNHGKKITVHLKRHHRKYLFGALCSGILALIAVHTVSTINNIFANEEPVEINITYDSGANIMYVDTEGNAFTGIGTITISNGIDSITMLDRNLGATTNDINDTGSYGYHFQWGNNYGFDPFDESVEINATGETVDASEYGPGNYYSGVFIKSTGDWSISGNDNLRGGSGDGSDNNRGYPVINVLDRQGPCPDGYHVPSKGERGTLFTYWIDYYTGAGSGIDELFYYDNFPNFGTGDNDAAGQFQVDFKIPLAGFRRENTAQRENEYGSGALSTGFYSSYWSSTPFSEYSNMFFVSSSFVQHYNIGNRARANSVRCFKNPDDIVSPTCGVEYSTTGHTTGQVVAYLTGCSETITGTELTYTFTGNGTYTFDFQDLAGNTGSVNAEVTRIDRIVPTCNVIYDVTGATTGNVVASLTGCSETITGTELTYTFTGNGTYTFEFQNLSGSTGNTHAEVFWIMVQVNDSTGMLSLYNENNAISCEYNYVSGTYSEQMLFRARSGEVYQYLALTGYDTGENEYLSVYTKALYKSGKIYGWGSFFGSGIGLVVDYEDFDMKDTFDELFDDLVDGEILLCLTGVKDTSVFDLPDGITFYDENHYHLAAEDMLFSIAIDDNIKVGKDIDFIVKVMKDGKTYKAYTGTVYFDLTDKKGESIDRDLYELSDGRRYTFEESDRGRKTFSIKIKKEGTYILELYESSTDDLVGSEVIVVSKNGNSSDFEYDTLKFNPYFSDEDNRAYQYAYHYGITTTSSIKNANMYSGLNRIAMAKMLSNYAENVLGMNDFNTRRNCKFSDVSNSLDASYDYGVTKACQLGIMGINMPSDKFYPTGGVTRAEFATALSRLLYDTEDGADKYYTTHINKLRKEGIITNTDPKLREKRGFVMLMLMRAGETYDD